MAKVFYCQEINLDNLYCIKIDLKKSKTFNIRLNVKIGIFTRNFTSKVSPIRFYLIKLKRNK